MEENKKSSPDSHPEISPPCPPPTDDERIERVARELLDKHIAAFRELAK